MAKISLIFCSFLLVSAFALPSSTTLDESILDIVKKIVNKVENFIDNILEWAVQNIGKIDFEWDDLQRKAIENAEKLFKKSLGVLFSILDKIAESSTDSGKKLAKCIKDAEEPIIQVRIAFLDHVSKCFGPDLVKLVKNMGPLVSDLKEIQKEAKAAASKIDSCNGDDVSALTCVLNVAVDILKVAIQIPEKIAHDLEPFNDEVGEVIAKVIQCNLANIDPLLKSSGQVLDNIAKCAA